MPYSLINTPALGYDLVRLAQGAQVSRVLRVALAAGPGELARLSSRHLGDRRVGWERLVVRGGQEGVGSALKLADQALERAFAGDHGTSTMLLRRLERAALGNLPALVRLLGHDILDWTWLHSGDLAVQDPDHALAFEVLADAAASAYCAERLDDGVRRTMVGPFLAARVEQSGPTGEAGTGHPAVDALLAEVAASDAAVRDSWRAGVDAVRPGTATWAPAMHQATWALHVTDRLRVAADAQLAMVVAFHEAGFDHLDAAYGVWNALSGAVQATVAADLLSETDFHRLTAVWSRVTGGDVRPESIR